MIKRESKYYTAGYKVANPEIAPFYLRALVFDGKEGDFNAGLIDSFNEYLRNEDKLSRSCLERCDLSKGVFPKKIVVINASHDKLPTSYETARIFEEYLKEKGQSVQAKVVNTHQELTDELKTFSDETLVVSQCVDKKVYNTDIAERFETEGIVVVPGKSTAPGGVFSDKDTTYRLLSKGGKEWSEVARYIKVTETGKEIKRVASEVLAAIDELERDTGKSTFFVKPHEGGGGLGGFRITKMNEKYIIPDLSKVSGEVGEIHPTFIDFDDDNEAKLRELLWVYKLFASEKEMSSSYLKVKLPVLDVPTSDALKALKKYLIDSEAKQRAKLEKIAICRDEAQRLLTEAITLFEKKFNRRYIPLVNEHIDFGLWGLRAHYRLSRKGPVLEAMYHRVFQLGFTDEGLGYVGSDNISNKQTGRLEILRLGPVNRIMLEAIGGEESLFKTLHKGANALRELSELVPEEERKHVPLRLQLDLAVISSRIGEGNADTARGLCLASRWTEFVKNAREWLDDSLAYYRWKKTNKKIK
ncbi:MAG: hypothetical protein ISS33_07050 [Candidatus Omnitrophica bacterium]|nr:hypothetical protein [Candidatus Omnitrophota bacterium]